MIRPSSPRYASVASALLSLVLGCGLGCGSNVQDLGRGEPGPDVGVVEEPDQAPSEGLGGDWAPVPLQRDLACPLTRPIEGDACPDRNTAPCTYHGAPEHSPDLPATAVEKTTTFCMCMQSHVWRCEQGVTIRRLEVLPVDGQPCVGSMVVERPCETTPCLRTMICRCAGDVLRCGS